MTQQSQTEQMSSLRDKILMSIQQLDYRALFMEGGCQFYALVLNEKLRLPLFYMCSPDEDFHNHVFVMKDGLCYDYDGKKPIALIAKTYGGWRDVAPRAVTHERIREKNQR